MGGVGASLLWDWWIELKCWELDRVSGPWAWRGVLSSRELLAVCVGAYVKLF